MKTLLKSPLLLSAISLLLFLLLLYGIDHSLNDRFLRALVFIGPFFGFAAIVRSIWTIAQKPDGTPAKRRKSVIAIGLAAIFLGLVGILPFLMYLLRVQ